MKASHRTLILLVPALACACAMAGLAGCKRDPQKVSTRDLAERIESADDDERREIIQTLVRRGTPAIPEILQAFQNSDKPATQMVLADAVAHMPRSEEKQEALQKMKEWTRNESIRGTIQAYLDDPR